MSADNIRGPWRRGGQAQFNDNDATFTELTTGTDIWNADGQPVVMLADFFDYDSLDLIASAPTLRSQLSEARAEIELLRGALGRVRDKRVGPGAAANAVTGRFCHECRRYVGSGYLHDTDATCGIAEDALATPKDKEPTP